MEILVLNLMPNKIETENHLKQSLNKKERKVKLTFLRTESYLSKNTNLEYLNQNYKVFSEINDKTFDGFICTGAPVENLPFESVIYIKELNQIMQWARDNTNSSYYICWGANAALYYFYGIEKIIYEKKFSGVFEHKIIDPNSVAMKGLSGKIKMPVSRFAGVRADDIEATKELSMLLYSSESGPCLIENKLHKEYYNFNHFEYDANTLLNEYVRDTNSGMVIDIPKNYFPDNDINRSPENCWKKDGEIFFNNWLNNF